VADSAWLVLREQGAIIEEAEDDDGDGEDEFKLDEKTALTEKIGLHLQDVDIAVGGGVDDDGTRKEIRRGEVEAPGLR
jgi:hypothetical protein